MLQTLKKFITNLTAATLLLVPIAVPVSVSADAISDGLDSGTCLSIDSGGCDTEDPSTKVNSIINTVITIFSLVVGVVSVIMIIIGGLKYITSSGDSNNVQSAKNTILYAIIGLVIVAMAQFLVRYVFNKATTAGS